MSRDTLKWLRIIGPGFMAVVLSLPAVFFFGTSFKTASVLYTVAGPAAAVIFGVAYATLDIRARLWVPEQRDFVGEQIRRAILELAPPDLKITVAEEQLVRDRSMGEVGGIFWETLEIDPVLNAQKGLFYASGFLYSVCFDTLIIGMFASLVYSVASYLTLYEPFEWTSVLCLVAALAALFFGIPKFREKHLALSREQLIDLRARQGPFVGQRIRQIVEESRQIRN